MDQFMCSRCQDTLVYYEDVEEQGVLVRRLKNCDCREKRRFRAYCNELGVLPEKNRELEDIVAQQVTEHNLDLSRSIFLNGQGIKKAHIVQIFTAFLMAENWPEHSYFSLQNFIDAWFNKGRAIEGDLLLVTGYHEIYLDYWEDAIIATLDKKIQDGSRVWMYLDNNRFPQLRKYCYQNFQQIELPNNLKSEAMVPQPSEVRSSSPVANSSSAADRVLDDIPLAPGRR